MKSRSSVAVASGGGSPGTPTQLTTFTITDEGGSGESAGKVSQLFGVVLPPGKIPDGMYPEIRANDGTTVLASFHGGRKNFPAGHATGAGSWRFCFMAFRQQSYSAGETKTYQLWSSNTAPSSSGISNSSASAAGLAMELTGVTNLSGTWTATLATGISDNDDIITYADNGIAKMISVGQDFMQSGSPHGQLYMKGYVLLLKDASNNFAGIRYNLRSQQGWSDVSSPTAGLRTVTALLKDSGGTKRTLQGYEAPSNVLSSLGNNIDFGHYTRFFSVGTNGKWDFNQSGGSQSSDTATGMPVFSKSWLSAAELFPFDPAETNASNGTISYYPNANGPLLRDMSAGGERDEIGGIPNQCAKHFFNRAAADWQAIRAIALMSGSWRTCVLDSTTKKVITGVNASYTGHGTARPTWRYFASSSVTGVQNPSPEGSPAIWNSESEPSHRPQYAWYAYMMTGSPEFYDIAVEQGAQIVLWATPGTATFTTAPVTAWAAAYTDELSGRQPVVNGTTYDGSVLAANANLVRLYAWAFRDILCGFSVLPETSFDGAATLSYFNDLVDANLNFFNAYNAFVKNTSPNWETAPYNMLSGDPGLGGDNFEGTWTQSYLTIALAMSVAITRKAAAYTAATRQATFWADLFYRGGAAATGAYHIMVRNENGDRLEDGANTPVYLTAGPTISWVSSTDLFTFGGGITPTAGDLVGWHSFDAPGSPGVWASVGKMFKVINVSGQTFQLSQRSNSIALDVTNTSSCAAFYGMVKNCGSLPDYQNGWDYLPNSRLATGLLLQVGVSVSGLAATRAGQDVAFAANDAGEGPAAAKYRGATVYATV